MTERRILIAIDGSEHSERALDCKYIPNQISLQTCTEMKNEKRNYFIQQLSRKRQNQDALESDFDH